MTRLSARFSALFKASRRSRSTLQTTSLKGRISKPIVPAEDDIRVLLASSCHAHTHSASSSSYTLSDAELRALEDQQLGRRIADEIDDIIASYETTPCTTTLDPFADETAHCVISTSAQPASQREFSSPAPSSTYSESSVYSSPTLSPNSDSPRLKATLARFRDTPPPAPAWDKVSFGRATAFFGPDSFSDFPCGGCATSDVGTAPECARSGGGDEGRTGGRRDWRREFARRDGGKGYVVL